MRNRRDEQVAAIEATQLDLRASIEAAKALVSDADNLLKRNAHEGPAPNPVPNSTRA